MPNYNDAQGVADLLSQFDFNIINEGPSGFPTITSGLRRRTSKAFSKAARATSSR